MDRLLVKILTNMTGPAMESQGKKEKGQTLQHPKQGFRDRHKKVEKNRNELERSANDRVAWI